VIELKIIFLFYENCYIDKYKHNDTGVNGCQNYKENNTIYFYNIYLFYMLLILCFFSFFQVYLSTFLDLLQSTATKFDLYRLKNIQQYYSSM